LQNSKRNAGQKQKHSGMQHRRKSFKLRALNTKERVKLTHFVCFMIVVCVQLPMDEQVGRNVQGRSVVEGFDGVVQTHV
jgi:hypothetical protein